MASTSPPGLFVAAAFVLGATAGCATTGEHGQPLVPTEYQTRTGPFVVFTNFPLPADDGIVRQLTALKDQFEGTLGLKVEAADHPIEVYVLGDRKTFEHFLTFYYPGLPPRRAFFIAQGDRRVVYTFKSDRLDEDIRHEATHALIHASVGSIPLWLDEGLAEHFEVADGSGMNREQLARLPADLHDGWKPNLQKLEGLQTVQQMTPGDYRESWAWVHYLLHGPGEGRGVLLGYLGDLRKGGETQPLSRRLAADRGQSEAALAKYLEGLLSGPPPRLATTDSAVRLQDALIEIEPPAPPKKRSFLSRLFGKSTP
ncbi:MAG TPA: hypothetical protein VGH33_27785 [Isosphaeraceae bacterium]